MKQTIILISMLWTLSASAQFHTIGRGYSNIEKPISKSDTAAITKGAPPEDRGNLYNQIVILSTIIGFIRH